MLGVDVSANQPPTLPWDAWVSSGLQVAIVQTWHADHPEPLADIHLAHALLARVPHLGAYSWLGHALPMQCASFLAALNPAYTFCALDVEQANVDASDVLTWCSWFDAHSRLPLYLYGNNALAAIVAAHPELKRYKVWYAAYPSFPQPCLTPPFDQPRNVPASLAGRVAGWQYAGNNGVWPPYSGAIDRSEWHEIPGAPMPILSPGAGHGFHGEQTNQIIPIIKRGLQLGFKYKLLNSVENPGRCKDAHDLLPDMATISRFKFPHTSIGERWENGQDVETWSEQEHLDCARAQIQILFDRTNPTERAGIKFYTPGINEWNLTGDLADWTCVGHHLMLMMDEAERRTGEFGQVIRLAVPGISQGKPQYWQMKQVIATGCFDRMAARGDLFTVHEGRFRWETSDEIPGLGVIIPQAPHCPPYGGSGTGRINYWYDLGVKCDFAVTECYDGLSSSSTPAQRLARMKQTDDLYRHNPHYRGTAWFELVDNNDSTWRDTDFTTTFKWTGFEAEMLRESKVTNPTKDDEMPILYHAHALIDLALRDAAGNPATAPLATPPAAPGLAGVVKAGTLLHVYAENVTAGIYQNRATVTPEGLNVWAIPAALAKA